MYQSQPYHMSNYRGNQQGQESFSSASIPSSSAFAGSQNVTSQYRGPQRSFQPTGFVNSVYDPSNQARASSSAFSGSVSAQSYHTAQYSPHSRQQTQSQVSGMMGAGSITQQSQFTPSSLSGVSSVNQTQYVSPNAYHLPHYQGNQQQQQQSSQSQWSSGGLSASFNQSATGMSNFGAINQNQSHYVSPEAYHTANYRGNQQYQQNQQSQNQFGTTAGQWSSLSSNRF